MEWNLKWRKERDNLQFRYRMNYYRTRFGMYRKLYWIARSKDKIANAKRYAKEKLDKEAA